MAMMTTRFTTYRASGRLGPLTIAYFAAAIVAAAGAAWLYQMLMTWIPYIYVNLVLCGLFGAGLGAAGAFAVRRGHCRNRLFAFVLTLPLAAAGIGASYYWAYESTLAKIADSNPGSSVADVRAEVTFSRWVDARKEAGWTMSSSHSTPSRRNSPDISGAGVLVIWAIEALTILGIAALIVDAEAGKPYCERCGQWCTPKPLTLGGLGRADVEQAVQLGDLMPLVDIQVRSDGDGTKSILLTGNVCDGCSDTAFLSVDEKTIVRGKKQSQTKTAHLIKHAVLTTEQRAAFMHRYNFAVGQKLAA
jgi:phosphate/sulfate permease